MPSKPICRVALKLVMHTHHRKLEFLCVERLLAAVIHNRQPESELLTMAPRPMPAAQPQRRAHVRPSVAAVTPCVNTYVNALTGPSSTAAAHDAAVRQCSSSAARLVASNCSAFVAHQATFTRQRHIQLLAIIEVASTDSLSVFTRGVTH